MKNSRSYRALLILLALTAAQLFSCETEDWILDVDCNDCFGSRPDSTELIIHVDLNSENPYVPLEIYKGKVKGEPEARDTALTSTHYHWAAMDQEYTVVATYQSGQKLIRAFDSDIMKSRDYGDSCGDPCYIVKGGIYNLLLAGP